MQNETIKAKSIYELSEHNYVQFMIFFFLLVGFIYIFLQLMFPIMQYFFEHVLKGTIYNKSGLILNYYTDLPLPVERVSYYLSWAVDLYVKTPGQARYWFNPLLSLLLQSTIFSIAVTIIISAVLPEKYGLMRQKIEREILTFIEKIILANYGFNDDKIYSDLLNKLRDATPRDLYEYSNSWRIPFDDLKVLNKAIIWMNSGFFYRLLHVNDGIRMYMRFYFTVRYSNTVLGFVYIGAAVLIIIIGLRGLKFIPPTQPSLVLFALGLEFSLLIFYATTLIYSKQEEETVLQFNPSTETNSLLMVKDLGADSKEIEKLLLAFIKSKKN